MSNWFRFLQGVSRICRYSFMLGQEIGHLRLVKAMYNIQSRIHTSY